MSRASFTGFCSCFWCRGGFFGAAAAAATAAAASATTTIAAATATSTATTTATTTAPAPSAGGVCGSVDSRIGCWQVGDLGEEARERGVGGGHLEAPVGKRVRGFYR